MVEVLIGWPGGSLESALKLLGLVIFSYALVLWLSAIVWTYRDVRKRTSDQASQLIAVVLVALFNLPGLVVYLVIRPQDTMSDAYDRSLETEAVLHELQLMATSCQNCRRPIDDDFNVCPHCRVTLREPCRTCARSVRTSWIACPYCAADRVPTRTATPLARTTTAPLEPPRRSRPVAAAEEDGEMQPASEPRRSRPPIAR